jgi:hypothetical protein
VKSRRAFIAIDFIVGFALLAFLGTLLVISLSKMHRSSDRMAEDRAMFRDAESALLDLQSGKSNEAKDVKFRPIAGDAPAGRAWVEVTLTRDGREASLAGLVPQSAIGGKTP